ncbi:efflux transporter outer membrane subunit [Paraburkholderia metrosideri]|jgi:multidrug efflux system outer membrane protein|uniref:Antibiotic efflux pump outer membrane protein ArpC n=1 Tax=Paraburkholderia metrosideri TaxID=580937 RepID=A0ABM8NDK6_9BURK|nr:efflux transporter outer membrane subunit [Paraburkholderia metrosideri]CAD6518630.1 Antibiotic efflux pump outer membrane protein ArpC [Paraburkholderia metrosideri]
MTRARFNFRLTSVTLALLLAGCTVGPDFHAPNADVPAQWHDPQRTAASATGASEASVASVPTLDTDPDPHWWRNFSDPTLDALIERAARSNLDLQEAVLRIAEARTQVQSAAAQGLPDVRATGSYQREQLGVKGFLESGGVYDKVNQLGAPNSPVNAIAPGAGATLQNGANNVLNQLTAPINLWQVGFDASWELDLFGRVRRSVEAANAQTSEAIESRNDALLSLEAEVAQTYMQLRGAQALHDIAVSLVDQQREIVELTQSQAKVGLASELDVKSATAQLAQTQAQLPQYEQQIAQALNGLAYLVGEPPGALEAQLGTPAAVPPVPPTVPVGLPSTLARRRPDIRRAEASLHAATANVGVAVAQFYPDVSLTGQVGTRATSASYLSRWSSLFYSFGPSISLPIFQGGALVSNLQMSKAQQAEAALDYRKTVLMALRDVDNALVVYRTDQTRRDSLGDSVAAQQASFDLARDSYRKGITSFINVLDAERQLAEARQQYAQGTMQVSTDLVSLYKALGGGWQDDTHASSSTMAPAQQSGG